MKAAYIGSLLIGMAGILALSAQEQPPSPKIETFKGKVVSLSEVLKPAGIELDPDATPVWLALKTEHGKLYPLIKDLGSRAFFHDRRLLNRPVQLQARLLPEARLLHVHQVHTLKEGKLHEVFYWCEVCAIRRPSLEKTGVCECCGGQMDLRETTVSR